MSTGTGLLRLPFAGAIAALALAFLYLPVLVLVALSFNSSEVTTIWAGASTRWYSIALANHDMLRAAGNSLIVASFATAIASLAATAAVLAIPEFGRRTRASAETLIGLPLVVPEIVTAVALLMLFVLSGFRLGLVTIILAHTVFCIPFAYYPIRSRFASLDPALIEAASDLYAAPWRRFVKVELPLIAPGILAGALLAFISSLGDFVITYFVSGPGSTTLPVYIYGLIRIGVTPEVNALSALLLAVSIPPITFAFFLRSQSANPKHGARKP